MSDQRWRLVIHGGAGAMRPKHGDPDHEQRARAGLRAALDAGVVLLAEGGAALDAVETSVRFLEDDPCFNAGRGSVLTSEGHVELDAAIMDGATRRAGAVAGLRTTRAPITLARRLMEQGPHVFLSGPGADQFARDAALEQVENDCFVTGERRKLQARSCCQSFSKITSPWQSAPSAGRRGCR